MLMVLMTMLSFLFSLHTYLGEGCLRPFRSDRNSARELFITPKVGAPPTKQKYTTEMSISSNGGAVLPAPDIHCPDNSLCVCCHGDQLIECGVSF